MRSTRDKISTERLVRATPLPGHRMGRKSRAGSDAIGPLECAAAGHPLGLATLVQCLRRYVEAHPERFHRRESRRGGRRIVTIVLAKEGIVP